MKSDDPSSARTEVVQGLMSHVGQDDIKTKLADLDGSRILISESDTNGTDSACFLFCKRLDGSGDAVYSDLRLSTHRE
ncbi:MAG TPA: hypothetical protein VM842_04150 [Nitrospira sp.]|jgi:hypothetical protein|nr:hypothetical protein [Nitrospira sp.]